MSSNNFTLPPKPFGGDSLNQVEFDQFRQFLEEACGISLAKTPAYFRVTKGRFLAENYSRTTSYLAARKLARFLINP